MGGNTLCYYTSNFGATNEIHTDCGLLYEQMINNLSVQKFCDGNALAGGCIMSDWLGEYPDKAQYFKETHIKTKSKVYILADGSIIIPNWAGSNIYAFYPVILVDINGDKGPNTLGKDAFLLRLENLRATGFNFSNDLIPSYWVSQSVISASWFKYVSDIYN